MGLTRGAFGPNGTRIELRRHGSGRIMTGRSAWDERVVRLVPVGSERGHASIMDTRGVQSQVSIRPIEPDDQARLGRFYAELSAESRRARLFSTTRGLTPERCATFCGADHHHREGFVAELVDRPDGEPRIVGHLCLEPDGAGAAEVAIAIADDLQHHGIGHRLMSAGLSWAERERVVRFSATMLTGNVAIHRLLSGLGLASVCRPIGVGVEAIDIDLRRRIEAA